MAALRYKMEYIAPIFEHAFSEDFTKLSEVLKRAPGYNRSDSPSMLSAQNDAQAICTFLMDYRKAKLTYRSYLKEIERLVLWCTHVPKVTISELTREHLLSYREFLAEPTPAELWCGPKKPKFRKDGTPNPDWRPFVGPLSEPTQRKTVSILDSFFNYLTINNYLAGNPMAVDKRRKGKKSHSTERWLERDEINMTLEALDRLENTDKFQVIRAKYIILTLFYTGLRLAELAGHTMGDFFMQEDSWFLKVVGKGEKPRRIAVVDEYLDILSSYRRACDLPSALPTFGESTPLIPALDKISAITDNRIGQILRWAFDLGASRFESMAQKSSENKMKYEHKASKLKKASAHWLRHSYGTYLVKSGVAIEKVKELMGHSDISTTMIYVHIAKSDLHEVVQNLSLTDKDN